jgi:hypothetical protein
MNRLQFDGAWEGDVLPNGAFVAAMPSGVLQTVWGHWQAPEWIRYPRLHPINAAVAGQTQGTNRILEILPGGIVQDVGPACGNSATLYTPDGTLLMNPDCAAPYHGLGFRYYDPVANRPVSAADTYIDHDRHIFEWTEYGGITAGQGGSGPYGEDPCVILFNGRRYLLESGTCRVVRFTRQGDQVAIGFFAMDKQAFVGHWLTVAEILTLPDITDGEPIDPIDPEEPEEPEMDFPRAEWAVVEQMHQEFSDDFPATEDGARGWTQTTIEQLAFSFPGGGWCWKSSTPTSPPSKDAIARRIEGRFECWDVLNAAGVTGPRVLAAYPPIYHDIAGQHPIPVTPHNHLDGEDPEEPENPSDLQEQVDRLERESLLQQARITNLEDRVSELEQVPPSSGLTAAQVLALIDTAFASADISGRTQTAGGFLSHSHGVSGLTITRKP